jgi:hypothetical protein
LLCRRELLLSPPSDAAKRMGRERNPPMAPQAPPIKRTRTTERVSFDALARVDARVKEILTRREVALMQARLAAQRLSRP